mgnify:CR=1 FL=1
MTLAPLTRKTLLLFVLLALAWLFWSGYFKPLLLGLGLVSCMLTVYLATRMGFFKDDLYALRVGWPIIRFWLWLLPQIVHSSLEVAKVVLQPKLSVRPQLVELDIANLHPVDQVILGNAMTLTPGTLTVDLYDGKLLVHALTQAGAHEVRDGQMLHRVGAARAS